MNIYQLLQLILEPTKINHSSTVFHQLENGMLAMLLKFNQNSSFLFTSALQQKFLSIIDVRHSLADHTRC